MAFVRFIYRHHSMILQKTFTLMIHNAGEIIRLVKSSYSEIQQEPIIISLTAVSDSFQKSAAVHQQYNSKKAALVFFMVCFARDFLDPIARRVLIDFCILATPLWICFLLMPGIDWQAGLMVSLSQYAFLRLAAYAL
jgi:hypothetical protein